jgi:hypothetical protein
MGIASIYSRSASTTKQPTAVLMHVSIQTTVRATAERDSESSNRLGGFFISYFS